MSDQRKSLLIVKSPLLLAKDQRGHLTAALAEVAQRLGFEFLIVDGGMDAAVVSDNAPLLEALHSQVDAINSMVMTNQQLIGLVAEMLAKDDADDQDPDSPSSFYLDGSPIARG